MHKALSTSVGNGTRRATSWNGIEGKTERSALSNLGLSPIVSKRGRAEARPAVHDNVTIARQIHRMAAATLKVTLIVTTVLVVISDNPKAEAPAARERRGNVLGQPLRMVASDLPIAGAPDRL